MFDKKGVKKITELLKKYQNKRGIDSEDFEELKGLSAIKLVEIDYSLEVAQTTDLGKEYI